MTLEEFIVLATSRVPDWKDVEQAAERLGISKRDLCDLVARAVAERFLNGAMPWSAEDTAMNNLCSYALHGGDPDVKGLPVFARRVFESFDEGEYEHLGEPPEFQGEGRTRLLLETVMIGDTGVPASLSEEAITRRVRATVAALARRALNREVSTIVAARELAALRHRVGVGEGDSDFLVCVAIDSETDALPLGPVRQYWAADALARKDQEIAEAEVWAMEVGEAAFRNILRRFGGAA
jgi:hypothetical protein